MVGPAIGGGKPRVIAGRVAPQPRILPLPELDKGRGPGIGGLARHRQHAPRPSAAADAPGAVISGRIPVRFGVPSTEPATLELMDMAGRLVRSGAVGTLGAGDHAVDLAQGARWVRALLRAAHLGANCRISRMTLLD